MNAHRILKNKEGRFTAYVGLPVETIKQVDAEYLLPASKYNAEKWPNGLVEITLSESGKFLMLQDETRERIGVEKRGWSLTEDEQKLHWLGWYYPGGHDPTEAEVQSDIRNVIEWFDSFIEVE